MNSPDDEVAVIPVRRRQPKGSIKRNVPTAVKPKFLDFDLDQETVVFGSPPRNLTNERKSAGTPDLNGLLDDFDNFDPNQRSMGKSLFSISDFSPSIEPTSIPKSKLNFSAMSPLEPVSDYHQVTAIQLPSAIKPTKPKEMTLTNTGDYKEILSNARFIKFDDFDTTEDFPKNVVPKRPQKSLFQEKLSQRVAPYPESIPSPDFNTAIIGATIGNQRKIDLNVTGEDSSFIKTGPHNPRSSFIGVQDIFTIFNLNPEIPRIPMLTTVSNIPSDAKQLFVDAKKKLKTSIDSMKTEMVTLEEQIKSNPPEVISLIDTLAPDQIANLTEIFKHYKDGVLLDNTINLYQTIRDIQRQITSKSRSSRSTNLNDVKIAREKIEQVLAEPKTNITDRHYEALTNNLSFKVKGLSSKANVILANRMIQCEKDEGIALHAETSKQNRLRQLKREIVSLMDIFPNVTFDGSFLTILVSSPRRNCRFTIGLDVPSSYPWGIISLKGVKIDFGIDVNTSVQEIRQVLDNQPLGPGILSRIGKSLVGLYQD